MVGSSAKSTASNASRARKRVEAESAVLKRARDGSAFTRCEACNKNVPVVLIDMHSCSLDSKIRMDLEAQVVEKAVEISKTERKRLASSAGKGRSAKKGKTGGGGPAKKGGKRPQTAFFLFMADFRKEYKAAHPDSKNVAAVAKEGGGRWKSMTDEEKKPYLDKAAELKAQYENGEGSGENKVAGKEGEQEVDQPGKPGPYDDTDEDDDDYNDDNDEAEKPEDEKNDLDDDLDDDDLDDDM